MDIDGTLTDVDGFVPPSALTACREARRKGHLLYICSGRTRAQISSATLAIGFDGAASAGGSHIETGNTAGDEPYRGAVIFDAPMPVELIKQVSAYLNGRQCGFSLEKNDKTLSNRHFVAYWESFLEHLIADGKTDDTLVRHIAELKKNLLPENPEDIHDASVYEGTVKMMYVANDTISFADLKQNFGQVCEIFHGSIPYFGDNNGEIGSPGIHKGLALEKIAAYHRIPLTETIAFGDSDNDRKMIECAGIGVAMGNATDDLKAIADDITTSLQDNGIFNGFRKLGLI